MKRLIVKLLLLVAVSSLSSGCKILSKEVEASINGNNPFSPSPQAIPITKAPLVFSSYVNSLIRQAEIINPTAINNIFTIYNAQKNQLPQKGESTEMSPSALAAIFIIAGQVCGALKDKEVLLGNAERKVFRGFNLSPTSTDVSRESLVTNQAIEETSEALSQLFLGRSATQDEKVMFIQAKDQALLGEMISSGNNTKLVRDIAVILCTGVASSLEAISL